MTRRRLPPGHVIAGFVGNDAVLIHGIAASRGLGLSQPASVKITPTAAAEMRVVGYLKPW